LGTRPEISGTLSARELEASRVRLNGPAEILPSCQVRAGPHQGADGMIPVRAAAIVVALVAAAGLGYTLSPTSQGRCSGRSGDRSLVGPSKVEKSALGLGRSRCVSGMRRPLLPLLTRKQPDSLRQRETRWPEVDLGAIPGRGCGPTMASSLSRRASRETPRRHLPATWLSCSKAREHPAKPPPVT